LFFDQEIEGSWWLRK